MKEFRSIGCCGFYILHLTQNFIEWGNNTRKQINRQTRLYIIHLITTKKLKILSTFDKLESTNIYIVNIQKFECSFVNLQ